MTLRGRCARSSPGLLLFFGHYHNILQLELKEGITAKLKTINLTHIIKEKGNNLGMESHRDTPPRYLWSRMEISNTRKNRSLDFLCLQANAEIIPGW
jgi:hypothetical protein